MQSIPPTSDSAVADATPSTTGGLPFVAADEPMFSDEATCGLLWTNGAGLVLRANRLFAQWCGRTVEDIEGRLRLQDLLTPASRIFHGTHYLALLSLQGSANEISFDLKPPAGASFPVLLNARVRSGQAGVSAVTTITVFDATATRKHERALMAARREAEASRDEAQAAARALVEANRSLLDQEQRLRVTLDSLTDAVVSVDEHGRIDSINAVAADWLGVEPCTAIGREFEPLVTLQWAESQETRTSHVQQCLLQKRTIRASRASVLVAPEGTCRRVEDTVSPIRGADGHIVGAVWSCRDVTERHRMARSLEHAARHDQMTGLVTRDRLERAIAASMMSTTLAEEHHLVCHLDMDEFKLVNETIGHLAGDAYLRQVGAILTGAVRGSDTVARIGGDEFGVLLVNCPPERGLQLAETMRALIEAHDFQWDGIRQRVTASFGISELPKARCDASVVLNEADMACRLAKQAGRNRIRSFRQEDPALEVMRRDIHSVWSLRKALLDDRLVLFFQPIVSTQAADAPVVKGEVLLRLRDENGRLQPPAGFIAAAEHYRQMPALDRWVVATTLAWLAGIPTLQASINLSGQSLGDPSLLPFVLDSIASTGVAPAQICFEITETAAIGNLAPARAFVSTLRARGVRFALDDFGVGLSSFGYMRQLEVDYVKIDGSFVKDMLHNPQSHAIVESIHRVARVSSLQTVAEWVEDDAILASLAAIGVDYAQGYGVGRPRPIADWSA